MITVTNSGGREFNVRVVLQGDSYGGGDCLVHEMTDPLVEFYDATQDPEVFGERGQFAARYYLSTLLESPSFDVGLNLHGGVPSWVVTAANVRTACAYAERRCARPTEEG